MPTRTVKTSHGLIHVVMGGLAASEPTLLLIHGNSSSSKIFQYIIKSRAISDRYCIVACDLPGHGSSSNAIDPELAYTMSGYASCLLEVLTTLCVKDVVILGWSLGGHIALEMGTPDNQIARIRGVLLVGTPPSSGPSVSKAFKHDSPHMHLTGQEHLSHEEAYQYCHEAIGNSFKEWQKLDILRTDGKARRLMFQAFRANSGVDQVRIVAEERNVLFGVVNGGEEPFVNLDYIDTLEWANLWEGRCHRLPGLGHAPFWEAPEVFELALLRFIEACL
ncbi:hypothetical protein QQS21_001285 [Conoideocrella luteorostrata]|uniref:AB hydrolase-1 domain-containing protein n=1 Tax=Conoideocrella luteorostrata TaxID=1105319 RepID=A0AAJ0D069_9HYPO|nr:hypothetical protein QQS21_001285 [Conoideocrella luteorostrata]